MSARRRWRILNAERGAMEQEPRLQLLEEWMRLYGNDVMQLAYSYVKNYHMAQDLVQDVFLRAYTRYDSFRQESSVRTWLLSITANRCKDHLRSWSVRHEVGDERLIEWEIASNDTERAAIRKVEQDKLWEAVHSLPVKYREVVLLYYRQSFSSVEVAKVLGISEQSVRTRLHRGRNMLKEVLGGELDDTV